MPGPVLDAEAVTGPDRGRGSEEQLRGRVRSHDGGPPDQTWGCQDERTALSSHKGDSTVSQALEPNAGALSLIN